MDRIIIRDLLVRCIVGVNDWERREKQDIIINLVLWTNLEKPGRTDRFEDAVDYREIKKRIVNFVEKSEYFLIEAIAEKIAQICLENPKIQKVEVTVDKPSALRFAKSVAVQIVREKEI